MRGWPRTFQQSARAPKKSAMLCSGADQVLDGSESGMGRMPRQDARATSGAPTAQNLICGPLPQLDEGDRC